MNNTTMKMLIIRLQNTVHYAEHNRFSLEPYQNQAWTEMVCLIARTRTHICLIEIVTDDRSHASSIKNMKLTCAAIALLPRISTHKYFSLRHNSCFYFVFHFNLL